MQTIKKAVAFFVVFWMTLLVVPLSHADAVNFSGNNNQLIAVIDTLPNGGLLYVKDTPFAGSGNVRGNMAEVRRDDQGKTSIEVWAMINGGQPSGINELIRTLMTALKPGDELVFHEGIYQRLLPVDHHVGGTVDKPIIIRGYGNGQARPVFHNDAQNTNTWELKFSNIEVSYIEFLQRPGGRIRIDGVRKGLIDRNGTVANTGFVQTIGGSTISNVAENITFRNCVFRNQSANAYTITTNSTGTEYNNLVLEGNMFVDATNSGLYIGQQEGLCPHHGLIIRNNFFNYSGLARAVGGSEVGYTIQTKRGVTGLVLEDNIIIAGQGPGIFFYGAMPNYDLETTRRSYIRNNIFAGGRNAGILVGGGPITIENNIVIGNSQNIRFHTGYAGYRFDNVWRAMDVRNNFTALARGGASANFSWATEFADPAWGPFRGEIRGNVVGEGSDALAGVLAGLMEQHRKSERFDALMDSIKEHALKNERAFTEAEAIDLLGKYLVP